MFSIQSFLEKEVLELQLLIDDYSDGFIVD